MAIKYGRPLEARTRFTTVEADAREAQHARLDLTVRMRRYMRSAWARWVPLQPTSCSGPAGPGVRVRCKPLPSLRMSSSAASTLFVVSIARMISPTMSGRWSEKSFQCAALPPTISPCS